MFRGTKGTSERGREKKPKGAGRWPKHGTDLHENVCVEPSPCTMVAHYERKLGARRLHVPLIHESTSSVRISVKFKAGLVK